MTSAEALRRIMECLDGLAWSADAAKAIADILRQAGYRVRTQEEFRREELNDNE